MRLFRLLSSYNIFFFLSLFVFSSSLVAAGAEDKGIPSKIEKAVVFLDGAQVTRTATYSIPAGEHSLNFSGLTTSLNPQSIQVNGKGNFTILGVQHKIDYLEPAKKTEQVEALEAQVKSLQEQVEDENLFIKTLTDEVNFVLANKTIGGSNSGVTAQELIAISMHYQTRILEIRKEKMGRTRKVKVHQEEILRIQKEMNELSKGKGKSTTTVIVSVNAKSPTQGTFEISYLVKSAGWFPLYDLRSKDISSPVSMDYKANVFQSTGMDWEKVNLVLSTGNPFESGTRPTLQPWRLGFYNAYRNISGGFRNNYGSYNANVRRVTGIVRDENGETLIGANVILKGTSMGTTTDFDGRYALEIPTYAKEIIVSYVGYESVQIPISRSSIDIVLQSDNISLEEVVVTDMNSKIRKKRKKERASENEYYADAAVLPTEKVERTTTVEFVIDLPYTIASSGKQTTVQIHQYDLPASYEYFAVPKLDLNAFLTARVTGWENYDLLSGEANLFFEGTYLGKSYLDVNALTDTLVLSLGRDKRIVIERKGKKEFTKNQFIGDKRTASRAFDISVRNTKSQNVSLTIEDQFPISTIDKIEVKHGEKSGAKYDEDTGKLTWKMEIASKQSEKVSFAYSVKYPKDRRLDLE